MPKKIKTATWNGKRYKIVFETPRTVILQLPEGECNGHISRLELYKYYMGRFWRARFGVEII